MMHPDDELPPEPAPGSRRPVRRPPPTVAVSGDVLRLVAVIGCVAVALALLWWFRGRATEAAVLPLRDGADATSPAASAAPVTSASPTASGVLVDVRGAVADPGVRRLPAGSRVIDAVQAAGGLRPGRSYGAVNLAAVLTDGQQIRVGSAAVPSDPAPGASPGAQQGPLLDLNTASETDLEALDGIGPVLAGQIVQWRTANGPFRSVDDLLDVSGIGDATLAGIRDQVTVG